MAQKRIQALIVKFLAVWKLTKVLKIHNSSSVLYEALGLDLQLRLGLHYSPPPLLILEHASYHLH